MAQLNPTILRNRSERTLHASPRGQTDGPADPREPTPPYDLLEPPPHTEGRLLARPGDTLLCVDDEPSILNALRRVLRKEPYRLLTASCGEEGLEVLAREPVQVVVSDYRMPGMLGNVFLAAVREHHPDTVRVVLSGYADAHVIVEAINEGEVYRFLPKPWDEDELRVVIRQCFERYHLLTENERLLRQVRVHNEVLQQMNENLERTVAERTRSLQFSQEILEKLPLPVFGVSADGMIALVNGAVAGLLPAGTPLPFGMPADLFFPPEVNAVIQQAFQENTSLTLPDCTLFNHTAALHVKILQDGAQVRGCILVLETIRHDEPSYRTDLTAY